MHSAIATHSYREPGADRPAVLCIGGSDSVGLAGLHMDARACESMGVHPCAAVTAVTAQDNDALYALNPVPEEQLQAQLDAALALRPAAIKIGLLASAGQVALLARRLPDVGVPVVLDPVLATSSDGETLPAQARAALLEQLLPLATVVTPNLPEARRLLDVTGPEAAPPRAAARLRELGAQWAVVKGGHAAGEELADHCQGPGHHFELLQPRLDTPHLRGTGCCFASLLASALALGYEVRDALVLARMGQQAAIAAAAAVAGGIGCPRPTGFPDSHWPGYRGSDFGPDTLPGPFPPCTGAGQGGRLGLYPIVDRAQWLERLLPCGVSTAQLRIKDLQGDDLAREIGRAVAIARRGNCRLFINDHWELAIDSGAYGVHLGQEDLAHADLAAIHAAGLRLGISNHGHYELLRARSLRPSYLATGPVFATTTKDMPWVPHGLAGLRYWQRSLPDYPLVAIAGIGEHNIAEVAAAGTSGIALITAITLAADPEATTRGLIASIDTESRAHVQ